MSVEASFVNPGLPSGWLPWLLAELGVGPESVEEVERVRRDVCAYKERNLSEFGSVPVDEAKVEPVPGSWVAVAECEVEEAMCTLLLQLF